MNNIETSILEAEVSWNDSILGKTSNLIFGSVKIGWKKNTLRYLAGQWAGEYYQAIEDIIKPKKGEDAPESDAKLNNTATDDSDTDENNEFINISKEELEHKVKIKTDIYNFLKELNDAVNMMIKSKKNGILEDPDNKVIVTILATYSQKKADIFNADDEFTSNSSFEEFNRRILLFVNRRNALLEYLQSIELKELVDLSAIITELIDIFNTEIIKNNAELGISITDKQEEEKEKEREIEIARVKKDDHTVATLEIQLKAKQDELNTALIATGDFKKQIEELKKIITANNSNKTTTNTEEDEEVSKPIIVKSNDNKVKPEEKEETKPEETKPDTRTPGQKGLDTIKQNRLNKINKTNNAFNSGFDSTFKKSESILSRFDIISERVVLQVLIDKYLTKLHNVKVNPGDKDLITDKVNIKKLALLQASAENVYMVVDKADRFNPNDKDRKLEAFWKSLLLGIDNKFQHLIHVDRINSKLTKAVLTTDEKASIKEESTLINNAGKAGVINSLETHKSIANNQLIVMGFKRNSGSGYLLLQKLKQHNWYVLYNVLNSLVESQSEALGKTVANKFKNSNSMLVYLDFNTTKSAYMFMYNAKNGLIYNGLNGIKFTDLEHKLNNLNLATKKDFYSITKEDLQPDLNRRTLSHILLIGTTDLDKAEKIYGVDEKRITGFVARNSKAIQIASEQHKELMSYVEKLPE